ncbi:probable ubiquitin carboxyl-terminal hydrolase MINDY-4 [Pseudoliparis swirei]|uniref:probable ubiquitin carboxyl-terminal hydrolase MINDY-4 n=1 Tax=Pseudoliparis swirei TaxID=2059687 RepID=UPI0024BD615A|nr:probable ubiquitin carboxyl-terminal hydrolase MINDY-4 [Pseudoliparis swirei]
MVGRLRPVRVVAQHTPRPGCGSPDRELDAPVRAASRRLSLAQERPRPATTMAVSVEEASSSVVREYLSRKGLRRTIACMDEELPRTESSVNNRSHLRQILNMEGLYRKNKAQLSPLKTLLEIIVKHHVENLKDDQITISRSDPLQYAQTTNLIANSPAVTPTLMSDSKAEDLTAFVTGKHTKSWSDIGEIGPSQPIHTSLLPETDRLSSQNTTGFRSQYSEDQKLQPPMASVQDNESFIKREAEKKTFTTEGTQRSRMNRIRRGVIAGPISSTLQESNKKRPNRRLEGPQQLLRREEENMQSKDGLLVTGVHQKSSKSGVKSADCLGGQWESWSAPDSFEKVQQDIPTTSKVKSLTRPNGVDLDVAEMVLDDIDDEEDLRELSKVSFQRTVAERSFAGGPMDQHTAVELKTILLGSSLNCFNIEWRNQGFTFSDMHDLRYGIVQKKGGPCGVLASIQASVLKKLLFEDVESSNTDLQRLRPSNTTRRKCLALAVAEILWRAGEEKQATIAINSGRNHFTPTGQYRSEGVLEKITCFTVDNVKDLQLLLERHIDQFETGVLGCILLTISAVLSRSIEKVRDDMDVPTTTLIGAHGYCTQELVNLLLGGRAVSNVFDNDMELDSGNGNMTLLKGVKGHCDVGLMSLFEHYNICRVGAYLKTPRYPIWVVCSESHFSVLFGLQRELLTNQGQSLEFELYYYDGLANQQEEIRLTVSVGDSAPSCHDVDTDLIPPLEHCIRTRWKDAFVNWNDTEPIL